MDESVETHNEVAGTVFGSVFQVGSIYGDVHVYPASWPVVPHQLPNALPHFVGRSAELDVLTARLECATGGDTVLITTIEGAAGVGKTTLALHWARQYIERFPDGQLYIDLRGFSPDSSPMDSAEAVRYILDGFGVPADRIPATSTAQTAMYRSLTEGRRMLILLDNARDSAQVRPLLPGGPGCLVVVTSRRHLSGLVVRDQARHIVLGLPTAREARMMLAGFLGEQRVLAETSAVDDLVDRCARLPLALAVAGARVAADHHRPIGALVEELRHERARLAELSTGDGQDTDVRAVFSWSYTVLSTDAARLFRLLGVHPGPDTDLAAASSLTNSTLQRTCAVVAELSRLYLVTSMGAGRYRLHDLLRAYAAELAAEKDSARGRQHALHRVLDHYLHNSIAADRRLNPQRDPITTQPPRPGIVLHEFSDNGEATRWLIDEREVLLAATAHAAANGFDDHAWQLAWALNTFLHRQGYWQDRVAVQQTALAACERLGDAASVGRTHLTLGIALTRTGRSAEGHAHACRALAIHVELDDRLGQADTHHALTFICERRGLDAEARAHAEQALAHYRTSAHHVGEALALSALGWYEARLGDYRNALSHSIDALSLLREVGNRDGEAHALRTLGYTKSRLGRASDAIAHYENAIAVYRDTGDLYNEAETMTRLGDACNLIGDRATARRTWLDALAILDRLNHPDADAVRARLADTEE